MPRGRPKGSKNKLKQPKQTEEMKASEEEAVEELEEPIKQE